MKTIVFSLERDERYYLLFADLTGFYLWSTSLERLLGSMVPLAQYLLWDNEKMRMEPEGPVDTESLLKNSRLIVVFKEAAILTEPEILIEGSWMRSPQDNAFFVPADGGEVHPTIRDRIFSDLEQGNL